MTLKLCWPWHWKKYFCLDRIAHFHG